MSRLVGHPALVTAIARFEEEVRQLAMKIVRSVVVAELEARLAVLRTHDREPEPPTPRAAKPAPPEPAPVSAPAKIQKWTRDTIADELAKWLVSGTEVDASFVKRHGPPGLVAASKREFGRFEAAMNVAALRVAVLYPDGAKNLRIKS
ncbi:MAG TPA: hypothetical protein VGC41_08940 [Kofleriaceae bacterium]